MKISLAIARVFAALAFVLGLPAQGSAYMTLFNDDGNWAAATLTNPENGKITYRSCKNSMDRNQDESSAGSLAIICITVSYGDNSAMLGMWHSAPLWKPGEEMSCAISLDDGSAIPRTCKVAPSRFGKGQIVLSDDKAEIGRILHHKKLRVRFDDKGGKRSIRPLEFDLDTEALRKAEKEVYDFF